MNDAMVGNLLMILQAKFTECRQRWTTGNDLLYRSALKKADDEDFEAIQEAILYSDHAPRTDEILTAVRKTPQSAQAYTMRGFDRPGFERQAAGATPYDLMREGFEAKYAEMHPGEALPKEWLQTLKNIDASRQQRQEVRRETVAALVGDDDDYDPFGED